MPTILCYTRQGDGVYPDHNYPGHIGYLCDLEHALHLAISEDSISFKPLRNNTGILFAKCTYDEGNPKGTTKTLIDPWLSRGSDGSFVLCMVRRNQNAPDTLSTGCMMIFTSKDLVQYQEHGFLKVSEKEIRHPRCVWHPECCYYELYWENEQGQAFSAISKDLSQIAEVKRCEAHRKKTETYGIDKCIPGNTINISDEEAIRIRMYLDEIRNTSVDPVSYTIKTGAVNYTLPKARCRYSDGSVHEKKVDWDLRGISLDKPGVYEIPGIVQAKHWDFPIPLNFEPYDVHEINDPNMDSGMSDPCVTLYKGKYYLSSTGNQNIVLRCADTLESVFSAEPVIIHHLPLQKGQDMNGTWAAELHVIDEIPYLFTTICPNGDWTQVKSVVLRAQGDLLDPASWEMPRYCIKANGELLTEDGISLDMTYFRDHDTDYVMWSGRRIHYGSNPLVIEPANIYIATINPNAPWQLSSKPVCILRPEFGWDRCETEVEEAPYLLRHNDQLFVTVSGSSTGMSDLYCIGLLKAKSGTDLLNPESWEMWPYPLLTKESVPGEYGPGHSNFVKDLATCDTIMVYHAVPHDRADRTMFRHPAMRRLHWASSGLPYLEMTPDRDLDPQFKHIKMTLTIQPKEDEI
ncbi:MAG: family 43 glycosylhydrolase [Lentisphaerae bacterium]|nr:family 43 glycosylhydrolase [Lentisphaerota bacterium]